MARVPFSSVFIEQDGRFAPRQRIRVSGVEMGTGATFTTSTSFAGVEFSQIQGRDLDIETDGDVFVIRGVYQNGVRQ